MKNHVVLINHEQGQIETHAVTHDEFVQVWDLLHKHKTNTETLSYGAKQQVEPVQQARGAP